MHSLKVCLTDKSIVWFPVGATVFVFLFCVIPRSRKALQRTWGGSLQLKTDIEFQQLDKTPVSGFLRTMSHFHHS